MPQKDHPPADSLPYAKPASVLRDAWSAVNERFARFSHRAAALTGSPVAFALAVGLVAGWAVAGPHFKWSDSHSLFVNTVTTIITFLLVFLIQSAQNRLQDAQDRHAAATQLKLDAMILAFEKVSNRFVSIEAGTDDDLRAAAEEVKARRDAAAPAAGVVVIDPPPAPLPQPPDPPHAQATRPVPAAASVGEVASVSVTVLGPDAAACPEGRKDDAAWNEDYIP